MYSNIIAFMGFSVKFALATVLQVPKTSLIQGTFGGGIHGCQKFRKSSHGHSERDMAPTLSGISLFGHSNQRGLAAST